MPHNDQPWFIEPKWSCSNSLLQISQWRAQHSNWNMQLQGDKRRPKHQWNNLNVKLLLGAKRWKKRITFTNRQKTSKTNLITSRNRKKNMMDDKIVEKYHWMENCSREGLRSRRTQNLTCAVYVRKMRRTTLELQVACRVLYSQSSSWHSWRTSASWPRQFLCTMENGLIVTFNQGSKSGSGSHFRIQLLLLIPSSRINGSGLRQMTFHFLS